MKIPERQIDVEDGTASDEALILGTMALMTGYAQSAAQLASREIAVHICCWLDEFASRPEFSGRFKQMLAALRLHWLAVAQDSTSEIVEQWNSRATISLPVWFH